MMRAATTVVTALAIVVLGSGLRQHSFAAGTNPYGYTDSCSLSGTTTVISGWAADPNATTTPLPNVTVVVGGVSHTVATSISGYRDSAINASIDAGHSGDPKPGTYGFQATFSGLYKGSAPAISGTILNVGAGSNVTLPINTTHNVDSNTSKPYFVGGKVPDACLPAKPAPPPAPTPAPAPKPTPSPSPSSGSDDDYSSDSGDDSGTTSADGGTDDGTDDSPANGDPSADANALPSPGTLSAEMKVPTGNATKIRVQYGVTPVLLDSATEDVSTDGDETTVELSDLQDHTVYYYQIVRSTEDGRSATSPTANFTTKGYTVAVYFTNSSTKGIAGIKARITDLNKSATSDKDGKIVFKDVASGDYTLQYTYKGATHKQTVTTGSSKVDSDSASGSQTVTLSTFINVDKLSASANGQNGGSGRGKLAGLIAVAVLVLAAVAFVILRRRAAGADNYDYAYSTPPAEPVVMSEEPSDDAGQPEAAVALPVPLETPPPIEPFIPADPAQATPQAQATPTAAAGIMAPSRPDPVLNVLPPGTAVPAADPQAEHMGESLKEMVLRSMREEAQRRQSDDEDTPGGRPSGGR